MGTGTPRNREGLTERETQFCVQWWEVLGGNDVCPLDITNCLTGSKTVFVQRVDKPHVRLGADVLPDRRPLPPGMPLSARRRMSLTACLAHELAHAERFIKHQFDRATEHPDVLLDEAETSIHASYNIFLEETDRRILIEDAKEQLQEWLRAKEVKN